MALNQASIDWLFEDWGLALLSLSTATCVIYDHITTLDDEVELIWKRPKWTRVQLLFLANRYFGDGMQIYAAFAFVRHIAKHTTQVSSFITTLLGYLSGVVVLSMQGILISRISSMYSHGRKMTALLFIAFVIEWVSVTIIQLLTFKIKVPLPSPAPDVHLCSHGSFPDWLYTIWIPVACFDLLVLGLSLSPALKYYKSIRHIQSREPSSPPVRHDEDSLAYILFRDSITFPFISLLTCILNLFIWMQIPNLAQMGVCVAVFAPCIFGPRLILNLREAYYQPFLYECKAPSILEERNETEDGFVSDNINLNLIIDPG